MGFCGGRGAVSSLHRSHGWAKNAPQAVTRKSCEKSCSSNMDKITTTIKREWLREIAAGRKGVEYREIKPYWTRRLSRVQIPLLLRLINGMQPTGKDPVSKAAHSFAFQNSAALLCQQG